MVSVRRVPLDERIENAIFEHLEYDDEGPIFPRGPIRFAGTCTAEEVADVWKRQERTLQDGMHELQYVLTVASCSLQQDGQYRFNVLIEEGP